MEQSDWSECYNHGILQASLQSPTGGVTRMDHSKSVKALKGVLLKVDTQDSHGKSGENIF